VRRESRLDPTFVDEIAALAGTDGLRGCIQCGTCSAVCPLSAYMDHTPRRLLAMTRAGMKDDVLRSTSIWICAGCYACTVACPKQIPVTDVIYALKRTAIREGVHPKRFPTPVLAHEFERQIERRGRNTESRLAIRLYLRTRPLLLLKDGWLAQRLMRRGRMSLARESIRQREQLRQMLRAAETPSLPEPQVSAVGAEGAR
jgi:heterodisulfide reductase subunit C